MSPTHVALAGATGNLGGPILEALLAANYTVTALSRIGGSSSKLAPHPNLTIKEVDFASATSIEPALAGVQVVVCSLAIPALWTQRPLIDAAFAAGVTRFIPAEFGMDSANAKCIELPVCVPKAATQKYLNEKAAEREGFSWTSIANGWFLDWVLQKTTILMDFKEHTATLFNGGDVKFSAALLQDIAKAVIGVVEHPAETKNRLVFVHSAVVTQNQLIQYAKEKDGVEWSTTVKGTEELRREISEAVGRGDTDGAISASVNLGCSDPEYGCDYTGHEDNELLGVRKMTQAEVKALVGRLM